ncbi:MAG: SDR family oxidoreductase [Clostridia bacterium]|jgi:3-oxoacyl-[acyl-carrier protein] reductase|nr:SDR family oxidoreductase [Clostridia bacterium]
MNLNLGDQVALVTGAGSPNGFGRAIALALAREGCQVAVNSLRAQRAEDTAAQVQALGRRCLAVPADVTDRAQVVKMVDKVLEEFGRIDILVNNAGAMLEQRPFLEQDEEAWDRELALNLKAALLCTQAVLPAMIAQKRGNIINIASGTVRVIHPAVSTYSMAKAGLVVFTKQLAKAFISSGIRVNCVAPGWSTDTDFVKGDKDVIRKRFLPETPLGRGTEPEDVANTVAFLASEVSADIVGQVIFVDGGSTI